MINYYIAILGRLFIRFFMQFYFIEIYLCFEINSLLQNPINLSFPTIYTPYLIN
jgi:hypothetical protein